MATNNDGMATEEANPPFKILRLPCIAIFLLYSTILFLSKEAFRNACLSNTREHNWRQVVNLLWLMVPASAIFSIVLGYVWIYVLEQPKDDSAVHQYCWAIPVVCACCIVEMLGEPLYIIARIFLFNRLRIIIESVSVSLRCVILAWTVYLQPDRAISGYALGQVACSLTWTVGIYAYFVVYISKFKKTETKDTDEKFGHFPFQSPRDFLPKLKPSEASFSSEQVSLTWSFFKQGFLKQILTEGERYVMTLFDALSFSEQGIFDVINNLGSIAARFVFRPVEDSCYQFFAGLVKRDVSFKDQTQNEIQLVAEVLENVLKLMIYMGLIIMCFGYNYSFLLLHLYGGSILSSGIGPVLLRSHCIYILLLATNGVTECYLFAAMSNRDVEKYNFLMVGFSIAFLFLSWYLTKIFGSLGFILANGANMLARIICSCNFIRWYYQSSPYMPLNGLVPNFAVLLVLVSVFVITRLSEAFFCCGTFWFTVLHVLIGSLGLLAVGAVIVLKETKLTSFIVQFVRKKKVS